MENYKKGKNVEEPLERDKIPIKNLPSNFLWMQVRGGSKIRNLLTHALNEFPEVNCVVWTGFGQSVGKTVSCAEIMKRELGYKVHQVTKICYRLVEEYWDPLLSDLDQLVVKRKLPMIHILLSSECLDANDLGYQAPGEQPIYNKPNEQEPKNKFNQNNKRTPQNRQKRKSQHNRNSHKSESDVMT